MAHGPAGLRNEDRQRVWIKTAGGGWFTLISALGLLADALFISFDPQMSREMQAANASQMLTSARLIWAIDPAVWKPWFWGTLPSATLTILLWFWLRAIRSNLAAGGMLDWHSTQIRCLIALNQITNAPVRPLHTPVSQQKARGATLSSWKTAAPCL